MFASFHSEPGQVFTVRQCPIELFSKVGWCWLEDESSAIDEFLQNDNQSGNKESEVQIGTSALRGPRI